VLIVHYASCFGRCVLFWGNQIKQLAASIASRVGAAATVSTASPEQVPKGEGKRLEALSGKLAKY